MEKLSQFLADLMAQIETTVTTTPLPDMDDKQKKSLALDCDMASKVMGIIEGMRRGLYYPPPDLTRNRSRASSYFSARGPFPGTRSTEVGSGGASPIQTAGGLGVAAPKGE